MSAGWQQPLPDMPSPPPERAWHRIRPPEGYEPQWRRLVDAALELGLGPDDVAGSGLDPIADAREWKPATVALYTKVARYGGLSLPSVAPPGPAPPAPVPRPLTPAGTHD